MIHRDLQVAKVTPNNIDYITCKKSMKIKIDTIVSDNLVGG